MPADAVIAKRQEEARKEWNYPFRRETLDKHVTFAFNTRGNDIYWAFMNFLVMQTNIFKNISMFVSQSMWGPGAENLFKELSKYSCDYIVLMDTDVEPKIETVVRMIERDKDIVSCPTWMYDGVQQDIHLNCHVDGTMDRCYVPQQGGLQKVFNTSWACVLISHRVLETFAQTKEDFIKWSPLVDEKFKPVAPDSMFFLKAQALGFDVYMDWDCEFATHHKYVSLNAPTTETFLKRRLYGIAEDERVHRAINVLSRRQQGWVRNEARKNMPGVR